MLICTGDKIAKKKKPTPNIESKIPVPSNSTSAACGAPTKIVSTSEQSTSNGNYYIKG